MTAFLSSSVLLKLVETNRQRGMDIAGAAFLYFSVLEQANGENTLHAAKVLLVDYNVISSPFTESVWYCTLAVKTDNPNVFIKLTNLRLKNVFIEGYDFNPETYELEYNTSNRSSHFAHCDNTGEIDRLIKEAFQHIGDQCRTEWLKLNKPKLSLVTNKE